MLEFLVKADLRAVGLVAVSTPSESTEAGRDVHTSSEGCGGSRPSAENDSNGANSRIAYKNANLSPTESPTTAPSVSPILTVAKRDDIDSNDLGPVSYPSSAISDLGPVSHFG